MGTIAVDFDGVLNTYDGWKGGDELFEPRPGAKEFIDELFRRGFNVVIYSTRGEHKLRPWLLKYNFNPHIQISASRPAAICYVDDRAVSFRGDFTAALYAIEHFKAHWE
jgi:phosphoglycolate phosphatase-like HAD superfamily hydrolase